MEDEVKVPMTEEDFTEICIFMKGVWGEGTRKAIERQAEGDDVIIALATRKLYRVIDRGLMTMKDEGLTKAEGYAFMLGYVMGASGA